MWKRRERSEIARLCGSTGGVEKEGGFSTGNVARKVFHGFSRKNPQKNVEKGDRFYFLELMLVLMALTFSAKAVSVFIFFSTCWME